jgi:hypothetical protein
VGSQVRLCRAKATGEVYAMKKLKKSEMLSRGQVCEVCLVEPVEPRLGIILSTIQYLVTRMADMLVKGFVISDDFDKVVSCTYL